MEFLSSSTFLTVMVYLMRSLPVMVALSVSFVRLSVALAIENDAEESAGESKLSPLSEAVFTTFLPRSLSLSVSPAFIL